VKILAKYWDRAVQFLQLVVLALEELRVYRNAIQYVALAPAGAT
jgi:hypothetical protein